MNGSCFVCAFDEEGKPVSIPVRTCIRWGCDNQAAEHSQDCAEHLAEIEYNQ